MMGGILSLLRRMSSMSTTKSIGIGAAEAQSGSRPRLLEVDKWSASGRVLQLTSIVGHHPYPLDELLLMVAAFDYHRPDLVIDVGTHLGKSARIWFELSKAYQPSAIIHTIDACDPNHPEFVDEALGSYIQGLPVHQHIGDGYSVACTLVEEKLESNFLIYLDGDHRYETVRRELELTKIIKRGCILVHDTFFQPDSDYNHGPYLAIRDFLSEHPLKQVIHLQSGLPGMSYLGID
jgi:cephalosporin hydroxylase